jgi:hypothetical protein
MTVLAIAFDQPLALKMRSAVFCIFLVPWYLPRYTEFSRTNTPVMGKKVKNLGIGKKYPFYQPIKRQHSYIWWNYLRKYNSSPLIRPLSPKGHPSYKATHQKATPLMLSFDWLIKGVFFTNS